MSYVVSTCMATFCHGQDHPGGVPVPVRDIAAGRAPENPFIEGEAFLGSRTALSARHGGVGGRYQHHLPARPHATLGKFPFSRGDRSVRGFPRHRGPGQEPGPEVLDGDGLVVVHDPLGPHPGRVGVLALSVLVQLRGLAPGPPVATGWGLPALAAPAGHLPLRFGEFGGAAFPVPAVRQVIGGISCRRGGGHTQSIPIPPSASGACSVSRVTTNEAYQWPRLSW